MRNLAALALVSAFLVFGCDQIKKLTGGGDADAAADEAGAGDAAAAVAEPDAAAAPVAEADAAPAAPAAVTITATNAAAVARFPAETAVSDDDLRLAQAGVARTTPKTGTVVATIPPGGDVEKIAEYQNCILVQFANPKDPSSTLLGWIGKEAFTHVVIVRDAGAKDAAAPTAADAGAAKVDAGAPKLNCPGGTVAVVLSKDPVCRKRCTKDQDCLNKSAGSCNNATLAAGGVARVCVKD